MTKTTAGVAKQRIGAMLAQFPQCQNVDELQQVLQMNDDEVLLCAERVESSPLVTLKPPAGATDLLSLLRASFAQHAAEGRLSFEGDDEKLPGPAREMLIGAATEQNKLLLAPTLVVAIPRQTAKYYGDGSTPTIHQHNEPVNFPPVIDFGDEEWAGLVHGGSAPGCSLMYKRTCLVMHRQGHWTAIATMPTNYILSSTSSSMNFYTEIMALKEDHLKDVVYAVYTALPAETGTAEDKGNDGTSTTGAMNSNNIISSAPSGRQHGERPNAPQTPRPQTQPTTASVGKAVGMTTPPQAGELLEDVLDRTPREDAAQQKEVDVQMAEHAPPPTELRQMDEQQSAAPMPTQQKEVAAETEAQEATPPVATVRMTTPTPSTAPRPTHLCGRARGKA